MGLSMDEAMLVIQILDFKWRDAHPFPKVETLVEYTGRDDKTIRRYIRTLRAKGLVTTRLRQGRSNEYDFTPLFDKLRELSKGMVPQEDEAPRPGEFELAREEPTPNGTSQPTPNGTRRIEEEKEEKKPDHVVRDIVKDLTHRVLLDKTVNRTRLNRLAVLKERSGSEYSIPNLETLFSELWRTRNRSPPPMWPPKWRGMMAKLRDHYGAAECAVTIWYTLTNWEKLRQKWSLDGYPSVPLINGYKASLFPMALEGDREAAPRKKANARPQWAGSTQQPDTVGWD